MDPSTGRIRGSKQACGRHTQGLPSQPALHPVTGPAVEVHGRAGVPLSGPWVTGLVWSKVGSPRPSAVPSI